MDMQPCYLCLEPLSVGRLCNANGRQVLKQVHTVIQSTAISSPAVLKMLVHFEVATGNKLINPDSIWFLKPQFARSLLSVPCTHTPVIQLTALKQRGEGRGLAGVKTDQVYIFQEKRKWQMMVPLASCAKWLACRSQPVQSWSSNPRNVSHAARRAAPPCPKNTYKQHFVCTAVNTDTQNCVVRNTALCAFWYDLINTQNNILFASQLTQPSKTVCQKYSSVCLLVLPVQYLNKMNKQRNVQK